MSSLLPGLKKNLGVISSREIAPVVEGCLAERKQNKPQHTVKPCFQKNYFFYFKLILLMFLDNFNVLI
jgi:hypothetical protein